MNAKSQEYNTVHKWINYNYEKTGKCTHCRANGLIGNKIHWANISGEYLRDRKDWVELCAKCHQKFDNRYKVAHPIQLKCNNCLQNFETYPCFANKLFCSRSCYIETRKKVINYQMIKEKI